MMNRPSDPLFASLDPAIYQLGLSPDVTTYARHSGDCKFQSPGLVSKCSCKKYIYVARTPQSKEARIATYSRSWEEAERQAKQIRDSFIPEKRELQVLKENARRESERKQILLADALEQWITDKEKNSLESSTMGVYYCIDKQLRTYASEHGLHYLHEMDTAQLTRWRASWKDKKTLSLRMKQSRVIAFFSFCVRMGWLDKNPAGGRQNPEGGLSKITGNDWVPMTPYSPEQFNSILDACWLYPVTAGSESANTQRRIWTMALLLRWSGLAPVDAIRLRRDELRDDNVIDRTRRKTGKGLAVEIPAFVADALRAVPPGRKSHPDYFFWNGSSSVAVARTVWWTYFDAVFKLVNPALTMRGIDQQPQHPHMYMFRCTFAVEYLKAGGDIHDLAKLLGNTVHMCEKHYVPFVTALKEKVLERQRATFRAQGVPSANPSAKDKQFLRKLGVKF